MSDDFEDDDGNQSGTWREYQRLVLSRLKELKADVRELRRDQQRMANELLMLKVRAGFWGAVAGAIPSTVALLWILFEFKRAAP